MRDQEPTEKRMKPFRWSTSETVVKKYYQRNKKRNVKRYQYVWIGKDIQYYPKNAENEISIVSISEIGWPGNRKCQLTDQVLLEWRWLSTPARSGPNDSQSKSTIKVSQNMTHHNNNTWKSGQDNEQHVETK